MGSAKNTSSFAGCVMIVSAMYLAVTPAFASPIYKSTDSSGQTVYTSRPGSPNATPHALPKIVRGDAKLSANVLLTCKKHGGINCALGPDSDGSVICYDGFRDAANRFAFTCRETKLELVEILPPDEKGLVKIVVRNTKGVIANRPTVTYSPQRGTRWEFVGPDRIDPYGSGEFILNPSGSTQTDQLGRIVPHSLLITCENCG